MIKIKCGRCHRRKSKDHFYADPKRKTGVRGWCKQCISEVMTKRYTAWKKGKGKR